jgi:hypothetical protein
MIKKDKHIGVELILLLGTKALIYYLVYKVYAMTYHQNYLQITLSMGIVAILINWKGKQKYNEKTREFTIGLVGLILLIFFFTKPNLTYNQGKKIMVESNYKNVEELETRSLVTTKFQMGVGKYNAYLYLGFKDDEKKYLLLSPETGEVLEESMDSYVEIWID